MQIRKNILSRVTCAGSLSPSAVCRIQDGGDLCLVFDSCGSKVTEVNPAGDKFCFKSGSKAAEISHRSARISTPEDERASSSSSTQSLSQKSQYLASKPGGGGYLGQFLLGMCRWPLRTPTPL